MSTQLTGGPANSDCPANAKRMAESISRVFHSNNNPCRPVEFRD
ncbi:hypothetical protein [Flavitalea sp. BT771]